MAFREVTTGQPMKLGIMLCILMTLVDVSRRRSASAVDVVRPVFGHWKNL